MPEALFPYNSRNKLFYYLIYGIDVLNPLSNNDEQHLQK